MMMKTKSEQYTSDAIGELLGSVTPREAEKVERRMLLAMKIAGAMKAKGWKKKDLMEAMGQKNQSVVTKWLSGTHNFTSDTLMDLEYVLAIELIDVESPDRVVSRLNVQTVRANASSNSEFIPSWLTESVSINMFSDQKTYSPKPAEA